MVLASFESELLRIVNCSKIVEPRGLHLLAILMLLLGLLSDVLSTCVALRLGAVEVNPLALLGVPVDGLIFLKAFVYVALVAAVQLEYVRRPGSLMVAKMAIAVAAVWFYCAVKNTLVVFQLLGG